MRHLQDYNTYNESIKDYLVAGAIAASTALSSPKEVKGIDKDKIETVKGKEVEVKFKPIDSVSFNHSFVGLYDIRHSDNIQDVIIFNSGDKMNRKTGEFPETKIISETNTIKLVVKTEIKNSEYPYDIKVIDKSIDHKQGWGMSLDYPKFYLIPFLFEEDESRNENTVFSEITITNLKPGNYSFIINGNKIEFTVK